MKCILNGSAVNLDEACIPVNDLTLRRGYGLFDFFRVHDGIPMYLEDHLTRLIQGSEKLGMKLPFVREEIRKQVIQLIEINNQPGVTGIRIVVTGGASPDGFTPAVSNIIITQEKFNAPAPVLYEKGTTIISQNYRRELPDVKSINYLNAVYYAPKMREAGATEIIYHYNGNVSECTRSNVFCVKDGKIYTPVTDALEGVTRKNLIRIAKEEYAVHIHDFSLDFLMDSDEVFITSTIKRILPVSCIDGKPVGKGVPGPVTESLISLLKEADRRVKLDI